MANFAAFEHLLLTKYNQPFISAILSALLAQGFKTLTAIITGHEPPRRALLKSGGMPSAHSALALALFTSVLWNQGWTSSITGIAGILAVLILYDAGVIRRTMEEHAVTLRALLEQVAPERAAAFTSPSSLGHTAREIIAGAALGVVVAEAISWIGAL